MTTRLREPVWRKMLGLIHAGFDLKPLLTHRFAAQDFQKGIDAMPSGNSGKVVFSWT